MTIACIEIYRPGDTEVIQNWLSEHSNATVSHIEFIFNYCYIFYD